MSRDRSSLTPLQLRLRAAAQAAGTDLNGVASQIGVSAQTLRQMGDAKRSKNPDPDRLIAFAEATGAPVEWIVAGWEAVVPRSELPASVSEELEVQATARLLSEKLDALAEGVSKLSRQQEKTDARLRALERR